MGLYIFIAIEWAACIAVVIGIVRAVRRDEAHREARLRELEAKSQAEIAAIEAELAKAKAELPPDLVMEIDLSDAEAIPDLPITVQQAQPLVSALSQKEQSLGGSGFVLKNANFEPGVLRLTLSPIDRVGSAERVRQVAEQWNANSGPLPPGVTAARADVLAA